MHSTENELEEFRRLLAKGVIQKAYRALLTYMMELRIYFMNSPDGHAVSGLYQGYMDMTYFALFPASLKPHNLKIAIVFNFDEFRFEAWLSGRNREVQSHYWELFKDAAQPDYRVIAQGTWVDSILEYDLVSDFDLADPDALTSMIETKTFAFLRDIESFLVDRHPLT